MDAMREHKFAIGSRVSLSKRMSNARPGEYKVIRLLPYEGGDPQYRIKNNAESNERVAKEYELTPWKS